MTIQPLDLYTDGGVIGHNPSLIGGTWAWCLVDADDKRGGPVSVHNVFVDAECTRQARLVTR